jgi:3D (Asp-Asp-Asp) domain-containing protein
MNVYATWYNASHGGRAPGDPNYGRTATGVYATHGVVAVDPKVIPLGTRMYIPGYGYAVAADTGGGVRGNHIDLAFPEGVANPWATGNVTIQILP